MNGIFVGPVDLALSCDGVAEPFGDAAADRLAGIASSCRKAGITAGIFTGSGSHTTWARSLGYTFVAGTSDVGLLGSGARRSVRAAREATVETAER